MFKSAKSKRKQSSDKKLNSLLIDGSTLPENLEVEVNLSLAHSLTSFELTNKPVTPSGSKTTRYAAQLYNLDELMGLSGLGIETKDKVYSKSMVTIREMANLENGMPGITEHHYTLGECIDVARKSFEATDTKVALEDRLEHALTHKTKPEFANNAKWNSIEFLADHWKNIIEHTGSMESIELLINNGPALEIMSAYNQTPGNLLIFEKGAVSAEGSLGKGQRTVVMGADTGTPQTFMQSVRLMAGERVDNALITERARDRQEALAYTRYQEGKRVLEAMPALETLKDQVKGRKWENGLINEAGLDSILTARDKLAGVSDPQEYRKAAIQLTQELGRQAMRNDTVVEPDMDMGMGM